MSKASEEISENASKLLEMARKKFDDLKEAEKKLFRCFADGELADLSDKSGKNNDPSKAKDWDKDKRAIRADRIAWLCTDRRVSELATHRGILVKGACIDGELDLQFAKISFPLYFERIAFMKGINLRYAEIREMFLIGTHTRQISADELKVTGNVFLREGFKAEGEVRLVGATIGGDLDCQKGQFINRGTKALNAAGLKVEGCVFLRCGFKAKGEVNLLGATIGGRLDCTKGQFINQWATALNANIAKIGSSVYLRNGFKAEGLVDLTGVTIGSTFDCRDGKFTNEGAQALSAISANIKGSVFLRYGFKAEGKVNLVGAKIGGTLDCENGQFINEGKDALNADGLKVEREVFLRNGFKAKGIVDLVGAKIGGDLDCIGGEFINKGATTLYADSANIKGNVFLRKGFKSDGEVNLHSAKIGGNLECGGGQFINPNGIALMANSLHVKNSTFFKQFMVEGEFSLVDAEINGFFYWMDLASTENLRLDFRSAKIGTLRDEVKSWPEKDKISLHGLVYNEIHDKAPRGAEERIDWLQRQYDDKAKKDKDQFRPQPYEQLAAVLRKGGQDQDARKILIAKNKDKARLTKLTWSEWFWYRVFGLMIGYGYRPWRALGIGFVIVLIGWLFFWAGNEVEIMMPTKDSAYVTDTNSVKRDISPDYPPFCAPVYSLDVFVPLVDLHQSSYWLPNANRGDELPLGKYKIHISGKILRYYLWFEIIAGWILTSLLVVGLTGLVRT